MIEGPAFGQLLVAVVAAVLGWLTGNFGPPNNGKKKPK